jgi:hypothetical protein
MIVERKQRRGRERRERPEHALRTAVAAYLSTALPKGAFFCLFPVAAGAHFHGLSMRELGPRTGFPQLLVLHEGRAYCIELKADGLILQCGERDCHAALQDARVPVAVARSLQDVQRFLSDECGLKMRHLKSAA